MHRKKRKGFVVGQGVNKVGSRSEHLAGASRVAEDPGRHVLHGRLSLAARYFKFNLFASIHSDRSKGSSLLLTPYC